MFSLFIVLLSFSSSLAAKCPFLNDEPSIIFIIFWDFLMFYQIFLPLQVEQCEIITYKHSINELPHKLANDLTLKIIENKEISGKRLNFIEWKPSDQSSY